MKANFYEKGVDQFSFPYIIVIDGTDDDVTRASRIRKQSRTRGIRKGAAFVMKDISHYTSKTSLYELFTHLYDKIIARHITEFSELLDYVHDIPFDSKNIAVLKKAFHLIKELNWGFFKYLDRSSYPKLWREIILQNETHKFGGDLKRNMSISSVYIGMLDIHGYTKFCQETKKNLSMLHVLDNTLQTEIRRIAKEHNVVSQRERGDEIILVGTTATDMLTTTSRIINYFSKKNIIKTKSLAQARSGHDIVLPDFKISAGIAGGNISTPLVITKKGVLSGFLLNTAARLQARANQLAPSDTKIMITNHVYLNFCKENTVVKSDLFKSGAMVFFNTGTLEFKGITIATYEAIVEEDEYYRRHYQEEMNALYTAVKKDYWEQNIFLAIVKVISKACDSMPNFVIEMDDGRRIDSMGVMKLCNKASESYLFEENYFEAIVTLREMSDLLRRVKGFDKLIIEYADAILERYEELLVAYDETMQQEIDKNRTTLFNPKQMQIYYGAQKFLDAFKTLQASVRKNKSIPGRKTHWVRLIEKRKPEMSLTLYSGKK